MTLCFYFVTSIVVYAHRDEIFGENKIGNLLKLEYLSEANCISLFLHWA